MLRRWGAVIACWLVILAALGFQMYKTLAPVEAPDPPKRPLKFASAWQTESQFIIISICTDLAEMAYYSSHQKILGADFKVTAVEEKFSADPPTYKLSASLPGGEQIQQVLEVRTSIWDPDLYRDWCLAFKPTARPEKIDVDEAVSRLTNPTPRVLAKFDRELSELGLKQMGNPSWHDEAALLLASLALREPSGQFFQIRQELCSLCAHLTMSDCLRGQNPASPCHVLAQAALAALYRREDQASRLLDRLPNQAALVAWKNALSTRLTGDYRARGQGTLLEERERFIAEYSVGSCAGGWKHRNHRSDWQQLADWTRFAYATMPCHNDFPGVGLGHEFIENARPAEEKELQEVCQAEGWDVSETELYNSPPELCLSGDSAHPRVQVLGRSHWGWFLQRQLCHVLLADYGFLANQLGDPSGAREYVREAERKYAGLRLLPFALRHLAQDERSYHQALDEAGKMIRSTPEQVPALAWNWLFDKRDEFPGYMPDSIRVVNEWHNHNPLPGTAYDLNPRMNHPSFVNRPDVMDRLTRMQSASPHDPVIYCYLFKTMDEKQVYDPQRVRKILKPVLAYNADAAFRMATAAGLSGKKADAWMQRAIELNPRYLYILMSQSLESGDLKSFEQDFERWLTTEPDRVTVSGFAHPMIEIYEKSGRAQKASALAELAADTYSYRGLCAKADLLEKRGQWEGALELYARVQERYGRPAPLIGALKRGSARNPKLKERLQQALEAVPGGLQIYVPTTNPPEAGVLVEADEEGLRKGDIIVAARGYRVQSKAQFDILDGLEPFADMQLVIYRGSSYRPLGPVPAETYFESLADYSSPD
ncbi:hypothetical protein JST97_19175 [bacterium]|nr:hypothetical protein [bacterium]